MTEIPSSHRAVSLQTFKDRFIQLIPEFLDSPAINDNAAGRSDDRELDHVARDLGLAGNGFLSANHFHLRLMKACFLQRVMKPGCCAST